MRRHALGGQFRLALDQGLNNGLVFCQGLRDAAFFEQ
jgi:hypothetical protein